METTVEKYKRRLEDMAELRQQVKELDELNSKYLDQVRAFYQESPDQVHAVAFIGGTVP